MTVEALRRRRPVALDQLLATYGRELQAVAYLILRDRAARRAGSDRRSHRSGGRLVAPGDRPVRRRPVIGRDELAGGPRDVRGDANSVSPGGIGPPDRRAGGRAGPGSRPARADDVGVVEGDGFYEVLYTCAGSAPFKLIWSEGTGAGEMLFSLGFQGCPGRTEIFSSGAVPPVARLSVETSPGMAWRVVVVKPTPDPILSGSPATGLPEPPAIDTEPLFVPVASTELLEGVAEAMLAISLPAGTSFGVPYYVRVLVEP